MYPLMARSLRIAAKLLPVSACRAGERLAAALQGKGAGSGWDLAGEVRAAASLIHTNCPVILDAGAHCGEWSLLLNRSLERRGLAGRFYLIEPSPTCLCQLNALPQKNLSVHGTALGRTTGKVLLYEPTPGSLLSSLHTRKDSFLEQGVHVVSEVPVVSLVDFLQEQNLETVDFLKMDLEGAELEVLRGAVDILQEGKVRALAFEFGSANVAFRNYFRDFWDLLTPMGFKISRIRPGGVVERIGGYEESLEHFVGATNYVAEKK